MELAGNRPNRNHGRVDRSPQDTKIDDEFAKTLGLESLDKLKEAARERLTAEFAAATRQRVQAHAAGSSRRGPPFRGAAIAGR